MGPEIEKVAWVRYGTLKNEQRDLKLMWVAVPEASLQTSALK